MSVQGTPENMYRDKSSQMCGTSTHKKGWELGRARKNRNEHLSPEEMDAEKNSRTDSEGAERHRDLHNQTDDKIEKHKEEAGNST